SADGHRHAAQERRRDYCTGGRWSQAGGEELHRIAGDGVAERRANRRVGGDLAIQEDRGRVVRATQDNRENAGRVGGGGGADGIAHLAIGDHLHGGRARDSRRYLETYLRGADVIDGCRLVVDLHLNAAQVGGQGVAEAGEIGSGPDARGGAEVGALDLRPGSRHQPSGDICRAVSESAGLQGGLYGWCDPGDKAVGAAGVVGGGRLECAGSRDQVRAAVIAGEIDVAGGVDCQPGRTRGVEPAGSDAGGEQEVGARGIKLGDDYVHLPAAWGWLNRIDRWETGSGFLPHDIDVPVAIQLDGSRKE